MLKALMAFLLLLALMGLGAGLLGLLTMLFHQALIFLLVLGGFALVLNWCFPQKDVEGTPPAEDDKGPP